MRCKMYKKRYKSHMKRKNTHIDVILDNTKDITKTAGLRSFDFRYVE